MSDLLREAEELAGGYAAHHRVAEMKVRQEACQIRWNTVRVATPERLAQVTYEAWISEAHAAPTTYAKNCCLEAARKWKERVLK